MGVGGGSGSGNIIHDIYFETAPVTEVGASAIAAPAADLGAPAAPGEAARSGRPGSGALLGDALRARLEERLGGDPGQVGQSPGQTQTPGQAPGPIGGCEVDACGSADKTPPPTPVVITARAFERAGPDATFEPASPRAPLPAVRDPAYIELANVEVGTTIEMLNLSKRPDGGFATDATKLTLTGRDVSTRGAAVYLSAEQMEALDLKAGDMLQLRAVDRSGNASAPVSVELDESGWQQGTVYEPNKEPRSGAAIGAMDGDGGGRKRIVMTTVTDARAPVALEDRIQLRTWPEAARQGAATLVAAWPQIQQLTGKAALDRAEMAALAHRLELSPEVRTAAERIALRADIFEAMETSSEWGGTDGLCGQADFDRMAKSRVLLLARMAFEPGVTVAVHNQRTGETAGSRVSDRGLAVPLNVADGDPLFLVATDANGVQGKPIPLVYCAAAKDGKGPVAHLGRGPAGVL